MKCLGLTGCLILIGKVSLRPVSNSASCTEFHTCAPRMWCPPVISWCVHPTSASVQYSSITIYIICLPLSTVTPITVEDIHRSNNYIYIYNIYIYMITLPKNLVKELPVKLLLQRVPVPGPQLGPLTEALAVMISQRAIVGTWRKRS